MTFVINGWVRGADFFGREALLSDIRSRIGRPGWVLGNRRVGKTSFLRQIEWLCRTGAWPHCDALYWDLQGAGSLAGLKDSFLESLEDAPDIENSLQLTAESLEDLDFPLILNRFRRKVKSRRGRGFLLLVDECEELVDVAADDLSVLSGFRKLSQAGGEMSLVLAGSYRLMDLDESQSRTSPFLPDFLPPIRLGPFSAAEAGGLLAKEGFEASRADEIFAMSFGNPHLVQLLGEHVQRFGNMDDALLELRRSKIGHYFFQSNFQCLPESMRGWWQSGDPISPLLQMTPSDPHFEYAVQSSLIRPGPDGKTQVNPLLKVQFANAATATSAATGPAEVVSQPETRVRHPVMALVDWLKANPLKLAVLPTAYLQSGDASLLEDTKNPPSLKMMASIGEDNAQIDAVLAGASPEYVLEKKILPQTAVYLAGLFLHCHLFQQSPFSELLETWERADAIASRDVPMDPSKARQHGTLAMVLLRCLKADPKLRYESLDKLEKDLQAILKPRR